MNVVPLNNKLFWDIINPSILIMAGVWFANGGKQFNRGIEDPSTMYLGSALFVLGWIWLISLFKRLVDPVSSSRAIWSSVLILGSVLGLMMLQKKYGEYGNKSPLFYVLIGVFSISWIVLGTTLTRNKSNVAKFYGWLAPILILVAMLIALPLQRKYNVVDAPGMSLFALGWVCLAFANSLP